MAFSILRRTRRIQPLVAGVTIGAIIVVVGVMLVASNSGATATQLTLANGQAWLASPKQGLVTLVDGPTEQVVTVVAARSTVGADRAVTQTGPSALVADDATGTVTRIDGATLEPSVPYSFAGDNSQLSVIAGETSAYVVDATARLTSVVDPVTLGVVRRVPMAARPGPQQVALDASGRLWVVDGDGGALIWFDPDGTSGQTTANPSDLLVNVAGRTALIANSQAEPTINWVDRNGDTTAWACRLQTRAGDTLRLPETVSGTRLFTVVPAAGTLIVTGDDPDDCGTAVQVGDPDSSYGPPVQSGHYVFVANQTNGTTYVIDLERPGNVQEQFALATPHDHLELMARDGLVFFNDLDSERAGVVTFSDGKWIQGKSIQKFNPDNPAEGVVAPAPAGPSEGGPLPNDTATAQTPAADQSSDETAPVLNSSQPLTGGTRTQGTAQSAPSASSRLTTLFQPPLSTNGVKLPTSNNSSTSGAGATSTISTDSPATAPVVVLGLVSGRITSNPSGIDCPTTCTSLFPSTAPVVLTATPGDGFDPPSWSGDGFSCAEGATCTVPAGSSVTVAFAESPSLRVVTSDQEPLVAQEITLEIASDAGPLPLDADWDLGDGSTATGLTITHSWTSSRTVEVRVDVHLDGGLVEHLQTSIAIGPMPAPVQISPADGTLFTNYPRSTTLQWQPVIGATQYHVEVECLDCQQVGQFSLWTEQTSTLTSFAFDWVADNQGRWRVTAIAADGVTQGETSNWSGFAYDTHLQTPVQLSPVDGTVFNNYPRDTNFAWNPVPRATQYHVEVACLDCQTSGEYTVWWENTSAATTFSMNFVGAQPGRWRVTAISATGALSTPSPWSNFTYTR